VIVVVVASTPKELCAVWRTQRAAAINERVATCFGDVPWDVGGQVTLELENAFECVDPAPDGVLTDAQARCVQLMAQQTCTRSGVPEMWLLDNGCIPNVAQPMAGQVLDCPGVLALFERVPVLCDDTQRVSVNNTFLRDYACAAIDRTQTVATSEWVACLRNIEALMCAPPAVTIEEILEGTGCLTYLSRR